LDIKKLFSGIAIIIDDNIKKENSGDLILKIRDQLKKKHIPILEYEDLPDDKEICNFKNINFILLDWYLFENLESRVKINEQLFIKNNIEFLKKIKNVGFIPVFIFSNQEPRSIIEKLSGEDIYNESSNNNVFIKRKQDLLSEDNDNLLFAEIEKWLKGTPSMYVLKKWEYSLSKAKRKLFWDFYEINPNWPSVLQKTFTDDGSDVNYELGNFIYKNLSARAEQIIFDDNILDQEDDNISKQDIRKVLEAERFIKNGALPDKPCTGDLFECEDDVEESGEKKYYLNIRPECDIAIQSGRTSNPNLYCLKGKIVDEEKIILCNNTQEEISINNNNIIFKRGSFIEKVNNAYISFVNDGKIIKFTFNDLIIKQWEKLKNKRIGRLLPPYITRVQQRYSSYLQRQGLPAIPEKAIK
jgi:hypothetical protein